MAAQESRAKLNPEFRTCIGCPGRIAARVATFSYRKRLRVPFFESIWDEAHNDLRLADRWLFVGYSLPEADIEIRHLLKTAQLARRSPPRSASRARGQPDRNQRNKHRASYL